MEKFQIIFLCEENDSKMIHEFYRSDASVMETLGISVGTEPADDSTTLMYRGFTIYTVDKYPKDERFINRFEHAINYLKISYYYPYIADLTIETFFVDDLNDETAAQIKARGWDKAFIKRESMALEHFDEGKSVWPYTSFEEILQLYETMKYIEGKFAVRKFIEKDILEQEERYWVLNGNIYHRDNIIPEVVKEAARRLNKLGSRYYTIDATPDFIVEVNPGESSDRHAVNSAELFASWIKKEFVK
jgi:hypothetical protein